MRMNERWNDSDRMTLMSDEHRLYNVIDKVEILSISKKQPSFPAPTPFCARPD